jgi:Ribbon-helix-helix domain
MITDDTAAKTARINLLATPAFRDELQANSRRTGVPLSEIIRRAVAEYLKREPAAA